MKTSPGNPGAFYFMPKFISNPTADQSVYNFIFYCPGCKCDHGIRTADHPEPPGLDDKSKKNFREHKWTFNGDFDNPTVSPSLHIHYEHPPKSDTYHTTCHSIIKNGRIQFLTDCRHDLKGQTVDLPEYEE